MTDQMQAIRDDLAFMREMTVSDEAAIARKSGAILTAAGVVFAGASVVQCAARASLIPEGKMAWVWLGSVVIFLGILVLILIRGPQARGVRDRAVAMTWTALGWAIFAIMTGFGLASIQLHSAQLMAGAPTVILAFYGSAWSVAAAVTGRRWMRSVAFGGYMGAVAIGFLVTSPLLFPVYAVLLLLLTAAPGVVLMRRKD